MSFTGRCIPSLHGLRAFDSSCILLAGILPGVLLLWLFLPWLASMFRREMLCFSLQICSKTGRVRSPKRRVRDDEFMLGSFLDCRRIVFILVEAIQGFSGDNISNQLPRISAIINSAKEIQTPASFTKSVFGLQIVHACCGLLSRPHTMNINKRLTSYIECLLLNL